MDSIVDTPNKDYDIGEGAREFEKFCLRPLKMAGEEAVLRLKIAQKWGGWRLKDELVTALGLVVGDTINAEVRVLDGPGMIRDEEKLDLFASGEAADWLLDNNIGLGSVIDAKVRFTYIKSPVGFNSKEIWTANLILIEGYEIVEQECAEEEPHNELSTLLRSLTKTLES